MFSHMSVNETTTILEQKHLMLNLMKSQCAIVVQQITLIKHLWMNDRSIAHAVECSQENVFSSLCYGLCISLRRNSHKRLVPTFNMNINAHAWEGCLGMIGTVKKKKKNSSRTCLDKRTYQTWLRNTMSPNKHIVLECLARGNNSIHDQE